MNVDFVVVLLNFNYMYCVLFGSLLFVQMGGVMDGDGVFDPVVGVYM